MHMRGDPLCGDSTVPLLPPHTVESLRSLLREEQSQQGSQAASAITVDSTVEAVCADTGLQRYLKQTKFAVHPCDEYRAAQERAQQCALFAFNLPPANEVRERFLHTLRDDECSV